LECTRHDLNTIFAVIKSFIQDGHAVHDTVDEWAIDYLLLTVSD